MAATTTRGERAALADSVRHFLADHSAEADVRRAFASPDGFDRATWLRMGQELGLQGLAVPEDFGGVGFGQTEQLVVLEEMGRALLCAPFLSSAVFATQVLLATEDVDACKEYLPDLCAATRIATVAPHAPDGGWDVGAATRCRASASGSPVLDGEAGFVQWAAISDLLLVVATSDDGTAVYAVEREQPGVQVHALETLDPTRPVYRVGFTAASARRVGASDGAADTFRRATPALLVAVAAESTGVARRALDMAVEYAKVREQYGRVIGSFQAVKHRCADILLAVEAATSTTQGATAAVDRGDDDARALAHLAVAQCSEAAVYATTENIELHGGIGYTWEHAAHLYYKRALGSAALYGSPAFHRAILVDELTGLAPSRPSDGPDDAALLELAADPDERAFAESALAFLSARAPRRQELSARWGDGAENLALFHESEGEQERAEAEAARRWQRARWDGGFGWITGPERFGGRNLPTSYERLYRMLESAFDVPDMNPVRIGLSTVGHAIADYGTDEQITRYGAGIQRGDVIACQLFSEPDAGSDLASVRTRGVRRDDGWHLDGQKVWTSNGTFAEIGLALVRTDAEAPKHRGLTMFVVPMETPGVDVRPLRQLTGGASFCEVFLTDVVIDDALRIGPEGEGWMVATRTLAAERRSTGDRNHETTARAVQLLWQLAVRTGHGDDPLVRDAWARVVTRVRSARFQQIRMQEIPDEELTGTERAIDKLLLVLSLRAIGELAADLLGPAFVADTGEWGTYGWNRWLMGALGYRIAGGTDEVLRGMLGERVLGLPREPR
ncbi:MAG TPA: acyl-CoA dehydrogenase [Jatrophihabitantaceae bacterium]